MTSLQGTCTTPGHEARPRPSHQWVCNGCITQIKHDLTDATELWDELTITLTRQDVMGGSGGGSNEPTLPFKPNATEAMYVLANTLGTVAGDLSAALRMQFPLNPVRWLAANVDKLAGMSEAGRLVDEIRSAVRLARATIDRPAEMLFAGSCPTEECGETLWAKPGDARVQCRECAESYEVVERRERMIEAAAVLRVTQTQALTWCRLLMDKDIPYRTWQSWRARGKLPVQDVTVDGKPLFLFGHARDLAVNWMARKGKAA